MRDFEYIPNVKGKLLKKNGGTICFNGRCFSGWFYYEFSKFGKDKFFHICYRCPIDQTLNLREVRFYLQQLQRLLKIKIKHIIKKNEIVFFVPVFYKHSHFLLTALRYINEFPEIIKDTFSASKISISKFLSNFNTAHNKFESRKDVKYNNLNGHGVISPYYKQPRSFLEARQQFNGERLIRVQSYLSKTD